jgi:hypothetical protein
MAENADPYGAGSALSIMEDESQHPVGALATQINSKALIKRQNLVGVLRRHQGFPDRNRVILWRFLLRLPMNEEAYLVLAKQKVHPLVADLGTRLPMKFSVILSRLTKLMSALVYWHPPLAECDWLPAFVFPFLQTCIRDNLVSFEIVTTIIFNWCQEWLYFIPNPPITILSRIERIAKDNGGTADLSFAWPVLRSFFGEVATTDAALMMMDHILSSRTVFLEYLVAAFAVLKIKVLQEGDVREVVKKAEKLYAKDVRAGKVIENPPFMPLPNSHYPVIDVV